MKRYCPKCGAITTIESTTYFRTAACEHCLEYWEIEAYDDCCKAPQMEPVRFTDGGGKVHVRKQCQSCGTLSGASLPGYSTEQKNALPCVDADKRAMAMNKWDFVRQFVDRCRQLLDQKKQDKDTLWWRQYETYLNSEKWKDKRRRVLDRDGHLCQACLKRPATQAHHKSYEFVGQEPLFDLISVCKPCHDKLHELRRNGSR